jgi:hypothetical protein
MTMIFPRQNYKSAKSGKYNQNSTSHGTWNTSMPLGVSAILLRLIRFGRVGLVTLRQTFVRRGLGWGSSGPAANRQIRP